MQLITWHVQYERSEAIQTSNHVIARKSLIFVAIPLVQSCSMVDLMRLLRKLRLLVMTCYCVRQLPDIHPLPTGEGRKSLWAIAKSWFSGEGSIPLGVRSWTSLGALRLRIQGHTTRSSSVPFVKFRMTLYNPSPHPSAIRHTGSRN